MTELLGSFRELRGIGPATEARLHEAGVYTWAALADVLAALAGVRGGVEGLRTELAELAGARDGAGAGVGSERAEAFVVRLSVSAGAARRCSATHVRSQEERSWPQWAPEDLVGFIRDHAELAGPPREPGQVVEPGPAPAAGGPAQHVVLLDAGKVFGGVTRPVELLVPTESLGDLAALDWTATLSGRALGADRATTWEAPVRLAGRAVPPAPVLLRFERVPVPGGLHRLWLRLELRLPAPVAAAPELAVRRTR